MTEKNSDGGKDPKEGRLKWRQDSERKARQADENERAAHHGKDKIKQMRGYAAPKGRGERKIGGCLMKGENLKKKNTALNGAANDRGRGGCSLGKGNAGGSSRRSGVFARAILVPLLLILVFTLTLLGFQTQGVLSSDSLNKGEETAKAISGNWCDSGNYSTTATYGGGDGSASNPYQIKTARHLARLAYMARTNSSNTSGKFFKLMNSIDISEHYWSPIGTGDNPFKGRFNGQGYCITGLTIDDNDSRFVGLFGQLSEWGDSNSQCGMITNVNVFGTITARTMTSGTKNDAIGGIVG